MAEEDLTPEIGDAVRSLADERGACPAPEDLAAYYDLDAAARAAHPIDPHAQICSRCQLVLLHLGQETAASGGFSWGWAAIAATVLIAVGLPMLLMTRQTDAPPPADTIRGSELQPVSPIGSVAAATTFTWLTPVSGVTYRVTVSRGLERVWSGTSSSTTLTPPADLRLEPGVDYRWIVEALDASGDVRLTSPPQTFRISGGR